MVQQDRIPRAMKVQRVAIRIGVFFIVSLIGDRLEFPHLPTIQKMGKS
jgi:hypothetical protein